MSYTIKRYGQPTITVPDGTINTETSITLVGKNYAGYGQFLDQNSMSLLQSFAGESPPSNPQYGQLWWNALTKNLNIFDGSLFKGIASSIASATAPASPVIGDMWFNTTDNSLNVYDGNSWVVVGPSIIKGTGTISTYIEDVNGLQHAAVEIVVGTAVVGIICKDAAFTPLTSIPGFTIIGPGYNVASEINGVVQLYNGTATNALALQGYDPASFMSAVANTSTVGSVTVLSNAGVTTGSLRNFSMMNSGLDGIIENDQQGGNITIDLNIGGIASNVATFYGANGDCSLSGNLHVTNINANVINANTIVGGYGNANVVTFLSSPGSNANIKTSGYFLGDGSLLSNLPPTYSNASVAMYLSNPGSTSNIKTSLYFVGDGSKITNISAANITGAYGNSNVSSFLAAGSNGNIVTTSFFVGDGSKLTNINNSQVIGAYSNANVAAYLPNNVANVSAAYFIGDGSLLTNVAGGGSNYGNANVAAYLPTYTGALAGGSLAVSGATTLTTGTISGTPTGAADIVNKAYVDTVAIGFDAKQACMCLANTNIALTGLQTIDGYTTVVGDRVCVVGQSAPANNGIYVAASGAWARAADMDAWSEVPGAYTLITQGTTYQGTGWVCTSPTGGTLGTTPITWVEFHAAGGTNVYSAGYGLQLTGTTFAISPSYAATPPAWGTTTANTGAFTSLTSNGTPVDAFPSGTQLVFAQATAPAGWSQVTTYAQSMLTVVSDNTGGQTGGSMSPILMNVVPSHTHSFSGGTAGSTTGTSISDPGHNHGIADPGHSHGVNDPGHTHGLNAQTLTGTAGAPPAVAAGTDSKIYPSSRTTTSSGTGVSIAGSGTGISVAGNGTGTSINDPGHSHSYSGGTDGGSSATNWTPAYVNTIICRKN